VRFLRRAMVGTIAAVLAAGTLTVISQSPAQAHGAMMIPGSRTYLCWVDGLSSTGQIIPQNDGCEGAVNAGGANALYNWFGVLRSDGAGRMAGFIPDGALCSGGNPTYSGFDRPRNTGYPESHLTAGSTIQIRYNNWARHPGTFRLYITRDGWNQNAPLSWSDLQGVPASGQAGGSPFDSVTNPAEVGGPGSATGYYYWNAQLPSNKTGKHIIYSVWHRSDSTETFYNCSDVVFDGGNGEVTGIGGGGGTQPPPPPPDPSNPPPNPGTGACTATYAAASTWNGGFQGTVTVRNSGTASIGAWTVALNVGSATIANLWNGTANGTTGTVTVRNANHNGSVAPNATTSFGFTANGSGTPTVSCSVG
jgi:predicted carbohydrate-binding protein with CBM5 and CBM33 domain